MKAALAKNEFEVPPALVERAIDVMLAGRGGAVRPPGHRHPEARARLRAAARATCASRRCSRCRGALLLEAIADAEKIEVTDEDLQAEVARMAEELERPAREASSSRCAARTRGTRYSTRLREDKALALLTSEARLKDIERRLAARPGDTDALHPDAVRRRADPPRRAQLRHLLAAAQGPHRLPRHADRRRRRERRHRAAPVPRDRGPGQGHHRSTSTARAAR